MGLGSQLWYLSTHGGVSEQGSPMGLKNGQRSGTHEAPIGAASRWKLYERKETLR